MEWDLFPGTHGIISLHYFKAKYRVIPF